MTELMDDLQQEARVYSPKINFKKDTINLTHGSGGRATKQLIDQLFHKAFHNEWLAQQNDAAAFSVSSGKWVMTTDAHVISPLFFPGGDIGSLSVHGTINDLAMLGAIPIYLTVSFILEEGFPLSDLQQIVVSMANAAREAQVHIIAGDTKVVERGKGDGVFITTTGLGKVSSEVQICGSQAKPGDHILVNGYIGDHGITILSLRNHLQFGTTLQSDTSALHDLVQTMLKAVPTIHCLRDPTRGGLATTLNELALQSKVGMLIDEIKIPIRTEVRAACELLGLDPLYIANEGKCVVICPPDKSQQLLTVMRAHPNGQQAEIIGKVLEDPRHFVQLNTQLGGKRIIDWLVGEQLPRIC